MKPSKIFTRFAQELGAGQSKPMAGFLRDMLYGISTRHSTMLSEIGRSLGEDADLITTEMRLSRNLANPNLDERAVQARYLEAVSPNVQDAVISLDFSEIRKDYAQKQEWLCSIWDNSRKEKARGYWLLNIEAVDKEGRHFPLLLEPFSQATPGYESQAHVVENGIRQVAPRVGSTCIWVLDRGFDGAGYIGILEKAGLTYGIRQVGRRTVLTADGDALSTAELAGKLDTPHTGQWHYTKNGREFPFSFQYGSAVVTFPKDGKKRRLIVVRAFGRAPLILLTNSLSKSPNVWLRFAIAYFKRWGIEEGTRLVKQIFDLENVRAMSFAGIRRLTLFAYLGYGFLCLFAKRFGKRAVKAVLSGYKSFGAVPRFLYYRLANAFGIALAGGP